MNVTPELIKFEMEYRLEQALDGDALGHVRAARQAGRPWWRRAFGHRKGRSPSAVNQMRPAT